MSDVAIIEPTSHAQITPVGVTFDDGLTIDEWTELGERLERHDRGLRWIVGDWLVFGSERFGARAAVIADSLSLATGSVANAASVCRRVPHERRRPELSFSHHEEVAHLDEAGQVRMLDVAIAEGLSKSVLRQLVQEEDRARRDLDRPVKDEPVDERAPDLPVAVPPVPRASSETVTLRICGEGLDRAVLADGVARVAEGLQAWLHGHGLHATVEVER